jgi:hypothetical protein
MSRTILPCIELPTSGNPVSIPFPDIALPVPGGWTVTVNLRTTDPFPGEATIRVMQGGNTIAASTIHPSSSFQDYTVSISDDEIDQATKGLCHISGLSVVISEIPSPCCPDTEIPDTLQLSVSTAVGCSNCGIDGFSTMTRSGNVWIGTATNCDRTWEVRLRCDPGAGGISPWILTSYCSGIQANSPYSAGLDSTCTPFELHYSAVDFGPTNNICNCLDEHGNPKGAQLNIVITA